MIEQNNEHEKDNMHRINGSEQIQIGSKWHYAKEYLDVYEYLEKLLTFCINHAADFGIMSKESRNRKYRRFELSCLVLY